MIRDAWVDFVPGPQGEPIIIVRVTKGAIRGSWEAQHVMNALRKKLPIEKIGLEIVVMDGEPIEQPGLFSTSPQAEVYVRSILSKIATHRWSLTKLDW